MNPLNPLTQQPISDQELTQLYQLVEQLLSVQADVVQATLKLDELEKREAELAMKLVPEKMDALGLRQIMTKDGQILKVDPFFSASLSEEYPVLKKLGLSWLRENNLGAVIKKEVDVLIDQSNEALLQKLREWLDENKAVYSTKEQVHHATLKALMRERIEAGLPFPMDTFRGFIGKKARVETPK